MQAQAQQTIADNVLKHTYALIEALKHNYIQYSIRGHQRNIELEEENPAITFYSHSSEYHQRCIDELKNGDCPIDYVIETGKKYHKVIFVDGGGSRSVHCFIDKQTGEMYKSASWKAPAKGVRYDLRVITDREHVLANCDWSGGYLYAR
jgi:hypothetical protein